MKNRLTRSTTETVDSVENLPRLTTSSRLVFVKNRGEGGRDIHFIVGKKTVNDRSTLESRFSSFRHSNRES